jgi:rhamnogalacturonyl hydrolase YesR
LEKPDIWKTILPNLQDEKVSQGRRQQVEHAAFCLLLVPVICQTFSKLYRATTQKTILFIVAIVRTSNPTIDQNEVQRINIK